MLTGRVTPRVGPSRPVGWVVPVVRWQGQVSELARQAGRLAAAESGASAGEVAEIAEDAAALGLVLGQWAGELVRIAGEASATAVELECGQLPRADGCGWLAMELDRLSRHLRGGEGVDR